ncbi:PREDICTED: uncharacterized protein LOC105364985 [Ceratosolen solmsi marchali]|uniref:Uncharacterized protein LOC105364985 n=1 Tax=Ceratosolen solmsi marchali TaxID=326594 RepID=A0AAJ6YNJ0_9HYME|nr:PREDICTED: uncharacterized protein LOC105364985 [Ceratosolen solmsi marchali]
MKLLILHVLIHFVIFGGKYYSTSANPLTGERIKLLTKNEFSSAACLLRKTNDNLLTIFCTATFFTTSDLVTTASCLQLFETEGFYVQAGSHDVRLGESYEPTWWITFDQYIVKYNKTKLHDHNDIGVIKLPFSARFVTPSPLSQLSPSQLIGKKVKVIGCTPCYSNPSEPLTIKKKAHVNILSNEECLAKAMKIREQNWCIPEYVLCTRNKPHAIMDDPDHGGPLILNGELLAITLGLMFFEESTEDKKKINLHLSIHDYREFFKFS